jgi:hypothetical protein
MPIHKLAQDTKEKLQAFETADAAWKDAWEQFETAHQQELDKLEQLREERNVRLEDAKKTLRNEVQDLNYEDIKSVKEGRFRAQKNWSQFYSAEKFVAMVREKGILDDALTNRIIIVTTTVADFKEVKNFLEARGIVKDFEECEDGREKTTSVYGPKPIPPLGAEFKEGS